MRQNTKWQNADKKYTRGGNGQKNDFSSKGRDFSRNDRFARKRFDRYADEENNEHFSERKPRRFSGEGRSFRNSENASRREFSPRGGQNRAGRSFAERKRFDRYADDENEERFPARKMHNFLERKEGRFSRNERPKTRRNDDEQDYAFYDKKIQKSQSYDDYDPNAKYNKKKQIEYKRANFGSEPIRLNRYLANAGICSRREADDYIQAGVVSVNGEIVSELGTKVGIKDVVKFHDQPVRIERKVYILLNKPKDCVTTANDPQSRFSVLDIVRDACAERVYPVGRLDKNTTGVLLLTNDGELTDKLTHPKYNKKKIYHAFLDKPLADEDFNAILSGIELEDGEIHADELEIVSEDGKEVGIEIHSGRNRIVRRIFEHLGYEVEKLDRVYFAGLTKKNLPRGRYRFLTEREVTILKMGSYE